MEVVPLETRRMTDVEKPARDLQDSRQGRACRRMPLLCTLCFLGAVAWGGAARAADLSIEGSLTTQTVQPNTTYELKLYIQNEASSGTGIPFDVGVYLSTDRLLDASDFSLGTTSLGVLSGDATVSTVHDILIPSDFDGSAYIIARVDEGRVLTEPDENNNTATVPIVAEGGIAVFLEKVSVQPSGTPASSISLGYDVDNQESQDVSIRLVARLVDSNRQTIQNESENKEVTVAPGVRSVQWMFTLPIDAALGPASMQFTVLTKSGEGDVVVGDSGLLEGVVSIEATIESAGFQDVGVYVGPFADLLLADDDEFKRFFDLTQDNDLDLGVKTVLLEVNVDTLSQHPSRYEEFMTRASSLGMVVHAVLPQSKIVEEEDEVEAPIQAVLAYGSAFPNSRFSGIHFSSRPENAQSVGGFLQAYAKLLNGVKTTFSYEGETLATQGLNVSIAVEPSWMEDGDVQGLLTVSDLDFFVIRPFADDVADVIAGCQSILGENIASKPFAIAQIIEETLSSGSGSLPSGNTWFEEGAAEVRSALDELALKYGSQALYRGAALASYESAFTSWHLLVGAGASSGTYQAGDQYSVNVSLRTSDPYAVRSYRVELQIRDADGQIFPNASMGDDQPTWKTVLMKGIDQTSLKLEWRVPDVASLADGAADVSVIVWDIDVNGPDDEGRPPVDDRPGFVELDRIEHVGILTIETLDGDFLASDFDRDGQVGFEDFLLFAGGYGVSAGQAGFDARFDLNGNLSVGFEDFLLFAQEFGQ